MRSRSWLVLALVSFVPLAHGRQSRLDEKQVARFAGALGAWLQAHDAGRDVGPVLAELHRELERLGKEVPGWDPLRQTADLGQAWALARARPRDERSGRVATEVLDPESFCGAGLAVAFRLPKGYAPGKARYPLILAVHDFDETPEEHLRSRWTLPAILEGAILVSPAMPSKREDWTRVAVQGRPGGLSHVLTAARAAGERFAVDPDRVYVVGRGKSVPVALAAGDTEPHRFAGIAGRAGDAGDARPDNLGTLPVWLQGAGAKGMELEAKAKAAGIDTLRATSAGGEPELWPWMVSNPRRTSPPAVSVVPGDPFPTRVAWLRIAPSASDARVTATIDREKNVIEIRGQGAHGATLYLNDGLVDLDRPVRFVHGGLARSVTVARSLTTALELLLDGTSDSGCVYVARVELDLTAADAEGLLPQPPGEDAALAEQLAAAGADPEKLWSVYLWCTTSGREAAAPAVLRAVLRRAPDHARARAALGHVRGKDGWFPSAEALERHERDQDPETARMRNLALHKGVWMHPEDSASLAKGWTRDHETGLWISLDDRRRLDEGWVRQDLQWIPPGEAHNVDLGLWKVGSEWLDLASANRRRARPESMWVLPGPRIVLHTTVEREVALWARLEMERACDDLRRVFGAEPRMPIRVALLRDEEQYDRFAFGDPDGRRRGTHGARLHAVHTAYFAESWIGRSEGEAVFRGMGVGYWDAHIPNGHLYGVHSARLAAGLSYVDALDPSPKAVRRALSKGPPPDHALVYEAEKRLPAWLRWGGAVYAERYFRDARAGAGRDEWWARAWSLDNLRARGGLRPLPEVLAFKLDPDQREEGLKLLIEAGLLVAFAVDGDCAPVQAALAELQRGLAGGRYRAGLATALAEALLAHEGELRRFAGM